jgi:FkbM family methyltransferase
MSAREDFWSWSTMPAMLDRAAKRMRPATIVDLGASDGRWAALAREVWPEANLLCIEGNKTHEPALAAFCARTPGAEYALELAAAEVGTASVRYNPTDAFQGIELAGQGDGEIVLTTTVDHELEERDLPGPYLLKFDTHGHEIPILAGAQVALEQTIGIVMEVYCWPTCVGCLRHWEMTPRLEVLGFRLTDMCDLMRRQCDGRLHEFDAMYELANAPGMDGHEFGIKCGYVCGNSQSG